VLSGLLLPDMSEVDFWELLGTALGAAAPVHTGLEFLDLVKGRVQLEESARTSLLIDDLSALASPDLEWGMSAVNFLGRHLPQAMRMNRIRGFSIVAASSNNSGRLTPPGAAIESVSALWEKKEINHFSTAEIERLVRQYVGQFPEAFVKSKRPSASAVEHYAGQASNDLMALTAGHPFLTHAALDARAAQPTESWRALLLLNPSGPIADLIREAGKLLQAPWPSYPGVGVAGGFPLNQLRRAGIYRGMDFASEFMKHHFGSALAN